MAKKMSTRERLHAKLKKHQPKKAEGGMYDIALTDDVILSDIKYVLTSGIEAWDTTIGGLPFGRVVEILGMESCGKTAMAIRLAVRANQKHIYSIVREKEKRSCYHLEKLPEKGYDVSVLYIDNEQSLEDSSKLWVDGTRLEANLIRTDTVEQLFQVIDITLRELILVEQETEVKQFLLVVVDTIACTSSKEEITRAWGKDDYNRQPKQLREGFRKMTNNISRHNVCVVCTNQVSERFDKIPSKFKSVNPNPNDYKAFGGKALEYAASYRVFMYKCASRFVLVNGAKYPDGFVIGFKSLKNRLRKPERENRMVLLYDEENGGISDDYSKLESLLFFKFAEMDDSKAIVFKFDRNEIITTTFELASGRKRDPRISNKSEWVPFYAAHKSDLDVLLGLVTEAMFKPLGTDGAAEDIESEEEVAPASPRRKRGQEALEKAKDVLDEIDK